MTRRKIRTWQPNEITSIIRSSQEGGDASATSFDSTQAQSIQNAYSESQLLESNDESNSNSDSDQRAVLPVADNSLETLVRPDAGLPAVENSSQETSACSDGVALDDSTNDTYCEVTTPVKRLKRTSSVRLSMSFDGKAEVIIGSDSPSPPRKILSPKLSSRPSTLQRSQSAIVPSSQSFADIGTSLARKSHGRSRDARTWQFYCDSDARNALTKTAEHEQRGSALGPIGLIRAGSSSRKPLTPSTKKQNSLLNRQDSGKRKHLAEHEGKKPKLARISSSVARLQSQKVETSVKVSGKGSQTEMWEDPAGDSDKENWEPGTQNRNPVEHARAPKSTHASQRGVLQENFSILSESSSLGALMERENIQSNRRQKQSGAAYLADKENIKLDEEVSAFMEGPKHTREEDDLDAVQNLLSLSQGAWR